MVTMATALSVLWSAPRQPEVRGSLTASLHGTDTHVTCGHTRSRRAVGVVRRDVGVTGALPTRWACVCVP